MNDAVLGALAEARALGFLGPGPLEAHVASAEAFAVALGDLEGAALDLGSGGGVPGLLLAATYPTVSWTLLDQQRRRTSFLARAVAQLGWVGRVEVVRAAAELAAHDAAYRGRFRAVTARSFSRPSITAEVAIGFLATDGVLVVAEPPEQDAARWPDDRLAELGLTRAPSPNTAVARFRVAQVASSDTPRSWRAMDRRPRW